MKHILCFLLAYIVTLLFFGHSCISGTNVGPKITSWLIYGSRLLTTEMNSPRSTLGYYCTLINKPKKGIPRLCTSKIS